MSTTPSNPVQSSQPNSAAHVLLEIRHAFDGVDVVVKNITLRKAYDCIDTLQSDISDADRELEAFGHISPAQYQKEAATLTSRAEQDAKRIEELEAELRDACAFMEGVMQERGDSGVSILIRSARAALQRGGT